MTDHFSDIDVGETIYGSVILSFKCQGSITKGDLVKMSTHTSGSIGTVTVVATTGDVPIGQALKSGSAGDYIPVLVKGVAKLKASGSITLGAMVKTAAPGGQYVVSTASWAAGFVGKALQSLSDGDTGLFWLDC